VKLLLVEDNYRLADVICRSLEDNGFAVDTAYDGLMGKKLALQNSYDLILSDCVLPKLSGIDLCKIIRTQRSDTPFILLTALGTTDDKLIGFEAGADDYMVKPFEMRELIARIKALLNRSKKQTNTLDFLQYADLSMNTRNKEVKRQETTIRLTPKEYKLLEFLVRNAEKIVSREEITQYVWEMHYDTGTNFIDVYINYLRKKIDKDFEPKLIHTRQGMGFILQASPSTKSEDK
jgi:DNA-binding response OmpR family regulator